MPAQTTLSYREGVRPVNVGLLFDRYFRFGAGWKLGEVNRESIKKLNCRGLIRHLRANADDPDWRELSESHRCRWEAAAVANGATVFSMQPEWRFVVGVGRKTALEAGLTFNRPWGFPVVPGSALKGLARSVALRELAAELGVIEGNRGDFLQKLQEWLEAGLHPADGERPQEPRAEECLPGPASLRTELSLHLQTVNRFRRVFGTTRAAGQAVFFDAIPRGLPCLEMDIVNVHHPGYYQSEPGHRQPPADWEDPVPSFFLTVGSDTAYLFAVGWRSPQDSDGPDQEQAVSWLRQGLTAHGIGAKTAAGYGYFVPGGS
ncbi:MAG: type III-B CRISPR module RAMP protein Cmr6 [bacterium]|nr:type III-B CRISPR module RAMP protein Cmr6 [bacterium]